MIARPDTADRRLHELQNDPAEFRVLLARTALYGERVARGLARTEPNLSHEIARLCRQLESLPDSHLADVSDGLKLFFTGRTP